MGHSTKGVAAHHQMESMPLQSVTNRALQRQKKVCTSAADRQTLDLTTGAAAGGRGAGSALDSPESSSSKPMRSGRPPTLLMAVPGPQRRAQRGARELS